ncbi:GM25269 [Drosophila sechellia]|uniref:GM25269 n=1 Tax=Drosophila sechellia TaxID=7238 RepID=B4HED2_DROSE|nr:GM25269 [Drosophila sechellia]
MPVGGWPRSLWGVWHSVRHSGILAFRLTGILAFRRPCHRHVERQRDQLTHGSDGRQSPPQRVLSLADWLNV